MNGVRHFPLAIIVATLCYFGLGAVWFTVFRNAWLEGIGKTMEQLMKNVNDHLYVHCYDYDVVVDDDLFSIVHVQIDY